MQKSKLQFVFFILFFAFAAVPVFAQEEASSATSSVRDLVRERVKAKIDNLTQKPMALVGTLEQVADSTLEIKDNSGKVLLASTSKDMLYYRVTDGKKKEIKFDELVIGEFVVAMGYRNGKDVLDAKRVIVYDKKPTQNKESAYGIVTNNSKGIVTIKHPKAGDVWTIKTARKTIITGKVGEKMEEIDIEEVNEGDRIVAVGTRDAKTQDTLNATRVHVIPGNAQGLTKKEKPSPTPTKKPTPTPTTTTTE
ncbi:MAG: hypothetical protein HYU80_03800 [Candidatus Blackburnbacteria bacterium]|nr:hypothetical protein [Candidatus Blackburnbacteria bacterium]